MVFLIGLYMEAFFCYIQLVDKRFKNTEFEANVASSFFKKLNSFVDIHAGSD